MEPIILVHGYSAESSEDDPQQIEAIFGKLPANLRAALVKQGVNIEIIDINVSRYVTLDDGVDLDDVSLALDRILRTNFPLLLTAGFNVIIHSTGALVMRNWVRRYSPKPSPCKRIIHLAGANLGSGWAHIGETQLAKWLRFIGQQGQERGLAVLDGLELGSSWAIDLHHHFLQPGNSMLNDYKVKEFSLVGSQAPPEWFLVPFRYAKEDGSDGVVRVSASNLNHNYLRIGPSAKFDTARIVPNAGDPEQVALVAAAQDFAREKLADAATFAEATLNASRSGGTADFTHNPTFAGGYYEVKEESVAGSGAQRPPVPFAIPYHCAHSTQEIGIVDGDETRDQVLPLVTAALKCTTDDEYEGLRKVFDEVTLVTYNTVREPKAAGADEKPHLLNLKSIFNKAMTAIDNRLESPEAQYDRHAQVIFRLRDQNRKPITDCGIHFNSLGGNGRPSELIDKLFEDTHANNDFHGTKTFYLRIHAWNNDAGDWVDRLALTNGIDLEIDSIDAQTDRILYIPLRMRIPADLLKQYICPHQTTIIDVELMRLPQRDTFSMYSVDFAQ